MYMTLCIYEIVSISLYNAYGYVMRKEGDCLEKEIMQGSVPGVRMQGRSHPYAMDE